jgi:pimeloyl-ACP methyl ester carboxylesterase
MTALAPLATNDPTGLATLRAGLDATRTALGNGSLFPQVGEVLFCSELFGGARGSALRGGRIVASGIDRCANRGLTFKPFDSASYPLAPPIFYFQGTNDPAVPVASARYHYDRQTSTSRALVTVPAAGHGPLTISLASCAPAFWSAIDRLDATAFATTASACGASLEGKLPGQ